MFSLFADYFLSQTLYFEEEVGTSSDGCWAFVAAQDLEQVATAL